MKNKSKILIVDDVFINRDILAEILSDEYDTVEAENGEEALKVIQEYGDDLAVVLLDLMMPVKDGFYVLEHLKKQNYMDRVPVLVISGETSVESENKCLDFGVADFIHKPFDETIVRRRVMNIIDLYSYKNMLEDKVAEQTKTLTEQNRELQIQAETLEKYNQTIVDVLGTVVESRNLESGDHVQRVKGYTQLLAEQVMKDYPEYGLTQKVIEVIVPASALHDVGKIAIPDNILLKPGKLTAEEFDEMKLHTTRGCKIIESIKDAWSDEYKKVSYEICRYHHEKYDGSGYPDGLKGEEIPLIARILAVADAYDAMTSKRSYRDMIPQMYVREELVKGTGTQFDPNYAKIMLHLLDKDEDNRDNFINFVNFFIIYI